MGLPHKASVRPYGSYVVQSTTQLPSVRTDGEMDRQTDRQTDRQSDTVTKTICPPPTGRAPKGAPLRGKT